MEVTIDDKFITIKAPINRRPSKSGKTMLVASSNGNLTTSAMFDGKPITIGFNAYTAK